MKDDLLEHKREDFSLLKTSTRTGQEAYKSRELTVVTPLCMAIFRWSETKTVGRLESRIKQSPSEFPERHERQGKEVVTGVYFQRIR